MEITPLRLLREAVGADVVLDLIGLLNALSELDRRCVSLIVTDERTGHFFEVVLTEAYGAAACEDAADV
jgi:hypothetical protein